MYTICYRGKIENSESVSKYICYCLKSVWLMFHIEDTVPATAQDMVPMNVVPTLPAALGIISSQNTFVTYEFSLFSWRTITGEQICSCFSILSVWELLILFQDLIIYSYIFPVLQIQRQGFIYYLISAASNSFLLYSLIFIISVKILSSDLLVDRSKFM